MSISSTTRRNDFTGVSGSGAQTVFAGTFKINAATEVRVVQVVISTGVETVLTNVTHYAITGVGDSTGFTCTLVTALPTTDNLSLRLNVPLTQPTQIRNQGTYFPGTHEDAFDYARRVDQQQGDAIDRSIKLRETLDPASYDMEVTPSASKVIGWNAAGTGLANYTDLTAYEVSAFAETLLDDTTAAAARTTLDAQQLTSSLTEDTAPAVGDFLPTYDISAAGAKKALLGAIVQGALEAKGAYNLGLANATTTNAADSINIQGSAAALSSTNPLYLNLPTVSSPGRVTRFSATADVTINITGAHWGLGTKGDFTDIILRVYAINDNGTLKWGVSNQGGKRSIVDTNSHTTATSCTTQVKMLVNSALSAGTWPCREVGWFLADFDDTGGAAEDLWAVQTAAGEIMVGVAAPVDSDWESCTMTCALTGGTNVVSAQRKRGGDTARYRVDTTFSTAFTGGTANFTLPTGDVIDTGKIPGTATAGVTLLGDCRHNDIGTDSYAGSVYYIDASTVRAYVTVDDAGTGSAYIAAGNSISTTAPMTWANNDRIWMEFSVPLLGRSGN